jgi:GxxExxY protein
MEGDPRTYAIIGAAMEVHRVKGCGFLEGVYQECLGIELGLRGLPFEREREFRLEYKGTPLEKTYKADFVCHGEVVVEVKALPELTGRDEAQLLNYLKASGLHVGLLLNFGTQSLEWRRLVLEL